MTANALARLQRDYKELCRDPILGVGAVPLGSNFFNWHVNLQPVDGVYEDVFVHLEILFTNNYPKSPPQVRLLTPIEHPNVFGNYICLSMLKEWTSGVPYEGWSSAYSASTICMQLQSFLFAENIPQDHGGNVKAYRDHSSVKSSLSVCRKFVCSDCRHSHKKPYPTVFKRQSGFDSDLPTRKKMQEVNVKTDKKKSYGVNYTHVLIDVLWVHVAEYLDVVSLHRVSKLSKYWKNLCYEWSLPVRDQVRCFFTKQHFSDCQLGIGLEVGTDQERLQVSSQMHFLSYDAWQKNEVRMGAWGERLTHFLPLALNKEHAARVQDMLPQHLFMIAHNRKKLTHEKRKEVAAWFNGKNILKTFAEIMNNLVVQFAMREVKQKREFNNTFINASENYYLGGGREEEAKPMMKPQQCERVLLGYVALHHLLLYLGHYNPDVFAIANQKVEQFIEDEENRHKSVTPDLGQFLIYVSVSKFTWRDIKDAFLQETLARNVLWICKGEKERCGSDIHYNTSARKDRLEISLQHTEISRKLIMFQVWFLNAVKIETSKRPIDLLNAYHRRLGLPPPKMQREMVDITRNILKCKKLSWRSYYTFVGMKYRGDDWVNDLLHQAVLRSWNAGYHRMQDYVPPSRKKEKKADQEKPDLDVRVSLAMKPARRVPAQTSQHWASMFHRNVQAGRMAVRQFGRANPNGFGERALARPVQRQMQGFPRSMQTDGMRVRPFESSSGVSKSSKSKAQKRRDRKKKLIMSMRKAKIVQPAVPRPVTVHVTPQVNTQSHLSQLPLKSSKGKGHKRRQRKKTLMMSMRKATIVPHAVPRRATANVTPQVNTQGGNVVQSGNDRMQRATATVEVRVTPRGNTRENGERRLSAAQRRRARRKKLKQALEKK